MALRTAEEYVESLRDNRTIWYRGTKVPDVTSNPELRIAVDHAAIDFHLAEDPATRQLAVADSERGPYSAYWKVPRNAEDLTQRSRLIETATAAGGTLVLLIKEIGSDALFALLRTLDGEAREKAAAYWQHCVDGDLAVCVGQTDVKGDRALGPQHQPDPDHYLRVVDSGPDGIVVRGAKVHTSVSANGNEIIILPTRAMGPDAADWAVSFACPIDTPGLSLYVSSYGSGEVDPWTNPVSSRHKMLETLTVFDDVVIPHERVFVNREPELAGPLALAFVEYHRFTAVSYKLPLVDALVGMTAEITRMNGTSKAGHIREKLTHLVAYAETVRALTELAATRARIGGHGIAYPDPMTTNLAKFTFASRYHEMLELVQDCAGGLLVTGPGGPDWDNPEIRPVLEKYLGAAAPAAERLPMVNLISDMTARDFGGYQAVLAVHAEGSIEAEKMQLLRSYDPTAAVTYARHLARLDETATP